MTTDKLNRSLRGARRSATNSLTRPADFEHSRGHEAPLIPGASSDSPGQGNSASVAIAPSSRAELAQFLRARRAKLTPEAANLPARRRRRTPGLRREEVAQLAQVGVTWYTWLEQGRDIHPSRQTLERIADALRLTPTDRAYVFGLIELAHEPLTDGVDPSVQSVLDGFTFPAMVANARLDVLGFNSLLNELYRIDAHEGRFSRNLIWRCLMDPELRALYLDWEKDILVFIGFLRNQYASHIGDSSFEELIAELYRSSPFFARAWSQRATQPVSLVYHLRLRAPRLGELQFQSTRFYLAGGRGDMLFAMAPADSRTAALLAKERRRLEAGRKSPPRLTGRAAGPSLRGRRRR